MPERRLGKGRWAGLLIGPGLFLLVLFAPLPEGMSPDALRVAAVAVWMAIWWITEAIPIPATALLPIALFPYEFPFDRLAASSPALSRLFFWGEG